MKSRINRLYGTIAALSLLLALSGCEALGLSDSPTAGAPAASVEVSPEVHLCDPLLRLWLERPRLIPSICAQLNQPAHTTTLPACFRCLLHSACRRGPGGLGRNSTNQRLLVPASAAHRVMSSRVPRLIITNEGPLQP